MALKILSGMVFVRHGGSSTGNAVINFDPFELAAFSNGVELRKIRQIGPSGRYLKRPATIVAARQFALTFPFPHDSSYRVRLNDTVTRDTLTIEWFVVSEGRVDQEEIPFMVIGEVADARSRTRTSSRRRVTRSERR